MPVQPSATSQRTVLSADRLRPRTDPEALGVASSRELAPVSELVGQDRAVEAIDFGTRIHHAGYNLYVLVPEGAVDHRAIVDLIKAQAPATKAPADWIYVHNFQTNWKPQAIRLPSGVARRFGDAVVALVDDLRSAIPALFESEDYKDRRRKIDEAHSEEGEEAFEALREKAQSQGIVILRTPMGFALAPVREGKVVKPDEFEALPEDERHAIQSRIDALQDELAEVLRRLPELETKRRDAIRALNAEVARTLVGSAIATVAREFEGIEAATDRLDAIGKDLVDNIEVFLADGGEKEASPFPAVTAPIESDPRFRRYLTNIMVANGDGSAADAEPKFPIVYEDYPSLPRLVGHVEHVSQMGTLVTDFSMIRAGALHRANGGYLVLDARRLLTQPWAWDALKRTLRSGRIAITSATEEVGLPRTTVLEPEPIDLDVKVVLIGEPLLYYMLTSLDPDFAELFKVQVEFDDAFERTGGNLDLYARLVATIAGGEKLKPLEGAAIAAVIDEATRMAGDAERLSLRMSRLRDLVREADHWSDMAGREATTADDVARAIAEQERRADRLRRKSLESIARGIRLIDTDGEKVGELNGLSVIELGHTPFGLPSRITARVRVGEGKVVDIEREVKLGGPIHSKGVLILSSYLAANYATTMPMSLWASLVFEQSYGGVEGDSASSAELYALISALSEVPISQSFAVTGSVNQLGEVQAIGGVNEKIEGFFDVCAGRGLTGRQGVLIPGSNIAHLVLRPRVIEAVQAGRFFIHAVSTIDEGIEILTGLPAGARGADGRYPAGTINARVEERLEDFATTRRAFGMRDRRDAAESDRSESAAGSAGEKE